MTELQLDGLVKRFGQPTGLPTDLIGARCGMAEGIPELGVWLQADGDVRNPYFGDRMLKCGTVERNIGQTDSQQ